MATECSLALRLKGHSLADILSLLAGILSQSPDELVVFATTVLTLALREKIPETMAEGLTTHFVWDTAKAIVHRIGRKDLKKLIEESIKEAVEQSAIGYDDFRQKISKDMIKAIGSPEAKEILRSKSDVTLLTESSEVFIMDFSQELAASIHGKIPILQKTLESFLADGMRQFQSRLLRKIAADQKLSNLVILRLGSETLTKLKALDEGIEAIKKRIVTSFQSFSVLDVSDLREMEKILHYNPPEPRLHGYVRRDEIEFDPSGKKTLIIGTPGSGKTTTIVKLLKRIRKERYWQYIDRFLPETFKN